MILFTEVKVDFLSIITTYLTHHTKTHMVYINRHTHKHIHIRIYIRTNERLIHEIEYIVLPEASPCASSVKGVGCDGGGGYS